MSFPLTLSSSKIQCNVQNTVWCSGWARKLYKEIMISPDQERSLQALPFVLLGLCPLLPLSLKVSLEDPYAYPQCYTATTPPRDQVSYQAVKKRHVTWQAVSCSVVAKPCWSTAASVACCRQRTMQAIWWGQQRRGIKMIRGLENTTCEGRLKDLWLFGLKKKIPCLEEAVGKPKSSNI